MLRLGMCSNNSYTEFTATEEIPERNKATMFQNQSGRKSWCCDQKVTPEG